MDPPISVITCDRSRDHSGEEGKKNVTCVAAATAGSRPHILKIFVFELHHRGWMLLVFKRPKVKKKNFVEKVRVGLGRWREQPAPHPRLITIFHL